MSELRAFHDSGELKSLYLARVKAHRLADNLIQGEGWTGKRGCAVGCTLERYAHARYPEELGIPVELAYLEDRIFEGLPWRYARTWPERFLRAIRPGADLSLVWPKFAVWLLDEFLSEWRTNASDRVVALYRRRIAGDEPTREEWETVAYDARAAYRAAAYAAAAAAAAYAAYAVASAAYAVAAYAAYAVAYAAYAVKQSASAAYADADAAAYRAFATKLLALIREAW